MANLKEWNILDYLTTHEEIDNYLAVCLEDESSEDFILAVLRDVELARAKLEHRAPQLDAISSFFKAINRIGAKLVLDISTTPISTHGATHKA